ncbi:MAG: cytochrome c [Gallionella sp.]
MKVLSTLILLTVAATAMANPFPEGNATAGQKLFEKNKCNSCHDTMMGGDGYKIFTRVNHKVTSAPELIAQITVCSGNVGANFTAQDKQNIGAYLNHYYKLD